MKKTKDKKNKREKRDPNLMKERNCDGEKR